jgi:hypothetical protein
MPSRMTRFIAAMTYRKVADTVVPMTPVMACNCEPLLRTCSLRARMPKFSSSASTKTMVECPREKKNPTESGRLPSLTSLRVVLSIAAMWSASKACRMPRV